MSPPDPSPYADNFVTQEQIDNLLRGSGEYAFPDDGEDPLGDIADFIDTDEIDRLLSDDDPGGTPDPQRENEMTEGLLSDDALLEDEELSMISVDDIQRVLSESDPKEADDAQLDELPLGEVAAVSVEETGEAEGDLISQEDIDRLLKNSGVAGDEGAEAVEEGFQISREEIDTILTDTREDVTDSRADEEHASLPVAPPAAAKETDETPSPERPRRKKKLFVVVAGLLLLFAVGGAAAWFLLLDQGDVPLVTGGEVAGSEADDAGAGSVSLGAPGEPEVVSRLDNFLIPAAEGNEYAFVSMHVVFTIRGVQQDPLAGYETFYRKRIYDALSEKLGSVSGEKPVERDLRELVRKTAGALLSEGVIDRVVLEDYRLM